MFRTWACSFCCTADSNIRFQIELFHNQEALKQQSFQPILRSTEPVPSHQKSPKAVLERKSETFQTPFSLLKGSTCSALSAFDLSYYSLFIFTANGDEEILPEQDLLYICEADVPIPKTVFELRKPNIGYFNTNSNTRSTSTCYFSMSNMMPFQSYAINYLRINSLNGKVHLLKTSSKFKIAFKERAQNLFHETAMNLPNQDFDLVFEDDPFFDKLSKLSLEELCTTSHKLHRKNIKSLVETAPPSIKTFRSSNDFSKLMEKGKRGKNSIFNSTFWFTESNTQSCNATNKNSVHEHVYYSGVNQNTGISGLATASKNKESIIADSRKSPLHLHHHHRMQSQLSKESEPRSNSKDPEISMVMNETFVVNESKENTDYVRKICSALDHNKASRSSLSNYHSPLGKPEGFDQSKMPSLVDSDRRGEHMGKKSEGSRLQNLKTTTKKTDFHRKPVPQFLSARKPEKNPFYSSQTSLQQSQEFYENEDNDSQDSIDNKEHHDQVPYSSYNNSGYIRHEESPIAYSKQPKAFRKIYESGSDEKPQANPYNYNIYAKRLDTADMPERTYYGQSYTDRSRDIDPKTGRPIGEYYEGGDDLQASPNIPRDSLVQSCTMSEKKQRKSCDFSFNGKIEELITIGNLQTTSESESMKVTPRLTTNPVSSSNGLLSEAKTILSPGERLYTVEEVGTPSKEFSTAGDGVHLKSFYSRKSLKNNANNNSVRLRTSDIYAVSELNEDEDRQSPLKFSHFGKFDSDQFGSIGGDLPIEVMVMVKKLDDLGLASEYNAKDCLFKVQDPRDTDFCFAFKWYKETLDRDLAEFFEDIRAALEARAEQNAQADEYVLL